MRVEPGIPHPTTRVAASLASPWAPATLRAGLRYLGTFGPPEKKIAVHRTGAASGG